MVDKDRSSHRAVALLEAVRREPTRYDLFQTLRRLEHAFPDRPRFGMGHHPVDEPARLAQEPSLAFSASVLSSVEWDGQGTPRVVIHTLGLFGSHGPLPLHLTEYARDRQRNNADATFVRFADIFHHRMLSLFYRAYAASQPTIARDRPESDRFTRYLGSLFGLGQNALRDRDKVPDAFKLFYAGRLAAQPHNAEGLGAMVRGLLGLKAEVEQFQGEWVEVPETSRFRVGGPGVGTRLGRGGALGQRAWISQDKFRLVLGPVPRERVAELLPGGARLAQLAALVRGYVGDRLTWDVQLKFADDTPEPSRFNATTRLGWNAWLGGRAGSVVFRP